MSHTYLVAFAPALLDELTRLKDGNGNEVQRYHNALFAVEKVKSDPKHKEFSKDLPDGYKAVDVLGQYRLFFRIEKHPNTDEEVIFFVWLNDESSLHRSGEPDDCYQIFRKMLVRGEISSYEPLEEPEERFLLHGNWGDESLHVVFKRILKKESFTASSFLALSKMADREYQIKYIDVSKVDTGLAKALLESLCGEADSHKITLSFDWYPELGLRDKNHHLLSKFGFSLAEEIEDMELWIRVPAV